LRKANQLDLNFKSSRPFVNVHLDNDKVKGDYELLIDTGNGNALRVLNEIGKDVIFKNSFEDYLGFGINGKIYVLRTKVNSIELFNFSMKKVAVSYPFKEYHSAEKTKTSHDGSIGGEILRRFDVVIDFSNKKISMRPNKAFDEGFYYNMSGLGVQKGALELFTFMDRDFYKKGNSNESSSMVTVSSSARLNYTYISKIFIDYVRIGSPGDTAGIEVGDQVISINRYNKKQLTMSKVSELFYKNPYRKLKIKLKRGDQEFKVEIINIPLVF
jgi:hypothetical protein